MLVLAGAFAFRWRDGARLGRWTLAARASATPGVVSPVVAAAGIIYLTVEAVAVLPASVLTFVLVRNDAPVLAEVERRFIYPSEVLP